ncbi:MAG: hypothetical protein J5704_03570 [Paludibacteraceae bacterium]|nr:hypothetical protein [Paludibacteraceae bacterium]
MMHRRTFVWLCLVAVLGMGCKRSAADYPLSNLRAIASFNLEFYHNAQANIHVTHEGEIDETNRMIYLSVPADADLTCLRPTIELSPWTTCEPKSLQVVDFSNGDSLDYVVKAQSGKIAVYTVYIKKDYVYTKAELICAYTPDLLDGNGEPRKALFATPKDGEKGTLSLPEGTDVSALRLHIDISNASYHSTIEICTHADKSVFEPYVDYSTYDLSENIAFIRITPEEGKALTYELDITYFTLTEDTL